MTQPGFRTYTDELRRYGTACADVGYQLNELGSRVFRSDANLPASAWGGNMLHLVLLKTSMERLQGSYENACAAITNRLEKIALQLDRTDLNLNRVADAYDVADAEARMRMQR